MADEFYGTVKFYNNEKSFGFIQRDDNVGLGDAGNGAAAERERVWRHDGAD
jgi:hypothetical protein